MTTTYGRLVLDGIEPVIFPTGVPIVGATLTVYLTGTTTPASLYNDAMGSTLVANPQTSDSAGRFYDDSTTLWADVSQAYDLLVTYPAGGSTTYDNVYALGPPIDTTGFLKNPDVALTGVPTAPTPAANDASSKIATTQFVATAVAAASAYPVGAELSFPVSVTLAGWQLEDGSAISRSTYPALFAMLGTTFGPGDGSTTFNVPDMQGQFPRGVNPTGAGPGPTTAAGAVVADQMQGHIHLDGISMGSAAIAVYAGVGTDMPGIATGCVNQNAGTSGNIQGNSSGPKTDGTNGTPRVGTETAPAFTTKFYYIKLG